MQLAHRRVELRLVREAGADDGAQVAAGGVAVREEVARVVGGRLGHREPRAGERRDGVAQAHHLKRDVASESASRRGGPRRAPGGWRTSRSFPPPRRCRDTAEGRH